MAAHAIAAPPSPLESHGDVGTPSSGSLPTPALPPAHSVAAPRGSIPCRPHPHGVPAGKGSSHRTATPDPHRQLHAHPTDGGPSPSLAAWPARAHAAAVRCSRSTSGPTSSSFRRHSSGRWGRPPGPLSSHVPATPATFPVPAGRGSVQRHPPRFCRSRGRRSRRIIFKRFGGGESDSTSASPKGARDHHS